MDFDIVVGDSLSALREMDEGSVRCVVTSPPYWGLRDYGHEDQIAGSGTVGVVALNHNRRFVGIELNPDFADLARDRILSVHPTLF